MADTVVILPMILEVGEWLEGYCSTMGLPEIRLDMLEPTGESMCLTQTSTPLTLKEYINGRKLCRLDFDIIAQGNIEDRNSLIGYLTTLCAYFENETEWQASITSTRTILKGTATVPSIRDLSENGMLKYAISVSLVYRED